ncbi:MAG: SDR family NAD(P)-dependent oxidoreductase, partial [Acidobacteriota bacterium]
REMWGHAADDASTAAAIEAVRELETLGAEVWVAAADVTDRAAMEDVVETAVARFGGLDGAIHAAGLAGARTISSALELDRESSAEIFAAKVDGTRVLRDVLAGRGLDFVLLISSNVSWLGGLGATAYAAANAFLDAFAATWPDPQTRWISTNWDGWLLDGAPGDAPRTSIDHLAMTPAESTSMVSRIVAGARADRVIVSTSDVAARYDLWVRRRGVAPESEATATAERRLETPSVPPENELQALILGVWSEQLGIADLGIHDNFFDLGGSSLIALKLAGRLGKALDRDVPVVTLFEAPTVATLAAALGSLAAGEDSAGGDAPEQSAGQRRREKRQQGRRRKRRTEVAS